MRRSEIGNNNKCARDAGYITTFADDLCVMGKPGTKAINSDLWRFGTRSAQSFWRDLLYSRSKGNTNKTKLYIDTLEKANKDSYRKTKSNRILTRIEMQLVLDIISFRKKGRSKDLILDRWTDDRFAAVILNVHQRIIRNVTKKYVGKPISSEWI